MEPPPKLEEIAELENLLGGYKLPAAYIELCQRTQNGGLVQKTEIPLEGYTVSITGIHAIGRSKVCSLGGEYGSNYTIEECLYPKIGIYFADCPSAGHEMIALDYSQCDCRGEPRVVYVDQEDDYRVTVIAKDFESFLRLLRYPQPVEDDHPMKKVNQDESSWTFCRIS
jgi:hypothetical protein